MKRVNISKNSTKTLVFVGAALLFLGLVYVFIDARQITNTIALVTQEGYGQFPDIDDSRLSQKQSEIVRILREEHVAQPVGTKYSEGVAEPWCADFVSWVLREAGMTLVNPHSQSWRIPGTHTLQEYFESKSTFYSHSSSYVPETGDIAIYDGHGPFGQHTNFVLRYQDGFLYTIGGNEVGKIRVQVHKLNSELGLVGFASIDELNGCDALGCSRRVSKDPGGRTSH